MSNKNNKKYIFTKTQVRIGLLINLIATFEERNMSVTEYKTKRRLTRAEELELAGGKKTDGPIFQINTVSNSAVDLINELRKAKRERKQALKLKPKSE